MNGLDWQKICVGGIGLLWLMTLPMISHAYLLHHRLKESRIKGDIWIVRLGVSKVVTSAFVIGICGAVSQFIFGGTILRETTEVLKVSHLGFMAETMIAGIIVYHVLQQTYAIFVAARLSGGIVSFLSVWLAMVIVVGNLSDLALRLALRSSGFEFRMKSVGEAYLQDALIGLLAYAILGILFLAAEAVITRSRTVQELVQHHTRTFSRIAVLLVPGLALVLALLGFVLLDAWRATLWLIFLIISAPVIVALGSVMRGEEQFTPELVIRMFKEAIMVFRGKRN